MAEPYLRDLQFIIERLRASNDEAEIITCKHFFSGAAAYVDGQIFMSLTPVGLALKLPKDDCAAQLRQGAKPLQYFPNAPVKKDYIILPSKFMDDKNLSDWISRSIEFVRH